MEKCPYPGCTTTTTTWYNLKVHLAGRVASGGHGVPEMDAESIAKNVFHGVAPRLSIAAPKPAPDPRPRPDDQGNPYAVFLARLFDTLVAHKQLPKYQFERRIDAIITLFLPGILKQRCGWDVELVAPEFPLKKSDNHQSTNVDHLLFRRGGSAGTTPAWLFFELKTDSASCNDLQLETYRVAMDQGMPRLLEDLAAIAAATNARAKYAQLQSRLARFPSECPIELVYLAPCKIDVPDRRVLAIAFQELAELKLPEYPEVWDLFRAIVLPNLRD